MQKSSSSSGEAHSRQSGRALNIGVDVRGLEIESSLRRGIGRYVVNLLRALAEGWDHRLVLLGDWPPWDVRHLEPLLRFPHVGYATYSPSFTDEVDVLLLTDPSPVLVGRKLVPFPLNGTPCATIFYDLIPLAFREKYLDKNPKLCAEYLARLEELKRTAAVFLTISEFVAADLNERLAIERSRLVPILGGLDEAFCDPPNVADVRSTLDRLEIRGRYFFYTGGADFRKNLAGLLLAFQAVRAQGNLDLELVLSGEIGQVWLKRLERESSIPVTTNVRPLGYVSDEDLKYLYAGATAFVFPSLYEGFGLPALEAMACGCPVIASDGSSLREIVADAGLLVNPQSVNEIAAAMKRLAEDPALSASLRERGREQASRFSWEDVASRTESVLSAIAKRSIRPVARPRKMRVLIQNRNNALIAPGGDTMVMEELFRALRARDVEVDVAAGKPHLRGVDVVHLVNLTVRSVAEQVAGNARSQRVPYVVTTLFEDWPLYIERSFAAFRVFDEYVSGGHDEVRFREGLRRLRNLPPGPEVGCREVAENAAALFACGESEAERLRSAYPGADGCVCVASFGIRPYADISEQNKSIARERVGFERFILCCGRLETRKNQLMLLKAMQDSDLPIVFLSGGFTYQAAYADLVTRFPSRAQVKILGRQGKPFLWNLMASAAVHVLPSWYELPGLVTLEAAAAGTAVVASDWGSIRDYLPEGLVHLCQPDDPDSIRRAVEAALKAGPKPEAQARAESFTWDRFGAATCAVYERILSRHQRPVRSQNSSERKSEKYITPEVKMLSPTAKPHRFDVSIIMPVYNHAQLTRECLEALAAAQDQCTYELIVVDNHSTDETPQLLQAVEGDVTILRQPVNRGFADACNIGARVAGGEFLVFLNNDTRPLSGWLDALIACARQDAAIGAVGAKLLYPEGDVQHAGIAFNDRRVPYHIFQHFAADHPAANETRDMKAVTAACMLVSASVFAEFDGFDEGYHNGFEDVDFCLRLQQKGYRVVYDPKSVVVHREEASDGRKDHDRENLERFMNTWSNVIAPDENEYLQRHGYTIIWQDGVGSYRMVEPAVAPKGSRPNLQEARELYASGKLKEAAAMLQRVVEDRLVLGSEDAFETWQTLGNCLAGLKRADEAERAFHAAIKLKPDSERPYLGLGAVAMLHENWQAAMYGFMMALAANPDTMKGEFGVGLSLAARNMHEDAIAHFSRVLEREPYNSEALFYLYRSAMESGQPRSAIEPIEKYLARFPDNNNFLFNLCGAYWKAGELARATDLCRQVLERDPQHAAARDVMEHLKSTTLVHA
jgi:glycosyltransferase involved in cell wall biosynthesis/GT2 family glycosyltransferase/Flp pilus assembly protein TadD